MTTLFGLAWLCEFLGRASGLTFDEAQAEQIAALVGIARFNVRSIPTLLVLRDGREVDRIVGVRPKTEIARRLEQLRA